jgi:Protein of unknown function (DUF1761)
MMPTITVNYLAVLVCAIVAMPVGFLWFGPLFGKAWARQMGFGDLQRPDSGQMAKAMAIFFVGNLLIAFVLVHSLEVWQASSWGLAPDLAPWIYALNAAIWTWVGFFLPVQMGRVAWEMKRWGLVAINASFDLTRLLLFAFILAYWR